MCLRRGAFLRMPLGRSAPLRPFGFVGPRPLARAARSSADLGGRMRLNGEGLCVRVCVCEWVRVCVCV